MWLPGHTPQLPGRERESKPFRVWEHKRLRKQKTWSGTMIAHISRARPALTGAHKVSGPSAREAAVEGSLEGGPPRFLQQRLGGALPGQHVCLGPLMRSVCSASLNTQVPIPQCSPSTCFQPQPRASNWKTGAGTESL